ncbi:hypothetical protein [Paenibacillus roseipurpureus]|uniref:LysM domain-containing protein n=1 Tax=Paenibacillus roseopurpureus TaxID=2918901 RepID=A0AA96RIA2_9BACL|nr:hypothetical protein [Paenibacillus sp. MBLB1832]WNR44133.1 hypothetical protein MJB10_24040 [Paenibacillus sp. MBLB1832]
MKRTHRTLMIGTLAAGLLISGGLVLQHNQAFADDTGTSTQAPKKFDAGEKHKVLDKGKGAFGGHRGPGVEMDARKFGFGNPMDFASILGIDQSVLKDEIKQGKSLVEIAKEKANLTEDELLAKLTAAETKKLDDAVAAGKLKQEQEDKLKAGIADRLKKIVESKPLAINDKKPLPRDGMMPGGMFGNPKEIAAILGITVDELAAERKAGKSLVEIAQAKGISEDQLIAKLKDGMTNPLKSFVERKGGDHPAPQPRGGGFKGKQGHGEVHKRPAVTATPSST